MNIIMVNDSIQGTSYTLKISSDLDFNFATSIYWLNSSLSYYEVKSSLHFKINKNGNEVIYVMLKAIYILTQSHRSETDRRPTHLSQM